MSELRCAECGRTFKTDRGLVGHIDRQHPIDDPSYDDVPDDFDDGPYGSLSQATDEAIDAAKHLTPVHAGTIAAIRIVARQIDAAPILLPGDVAFPTYLKYAMQLGLTPVMADAAGAKKEAPGGSTLRRLRQGAHLQSIEGGRSA
jgi:hypothetical protein